MAKKRSSGAPSGTIEFENDWPPRARARWFLDFVRTDLAQLTEGEQLALRFDATRFAGAVIFELDEDVNGEGPRGAVLPTIAALQTAQADYKAGMQRLRGGDWWMIAKPLTYGIARVGKYLTVGSQRGPFRALFGAAAIDVVRTFWDELFACLHCHSIFLKEGKQQYCSPECSRKARWKKYQAKRPARDYRAERTRRVRRRLGLSLNAKTRIGRARSKP